MDASKNLCDRKNQLLLEMKERCEISCAKILKFIDLLGSQYLFQILQTLLTANNSKNVVKSGCFENILMEITKIFVKYGRLKFFV